MMASLETFIQQWKRDAWVAETRDWPNMTKLQDVAAQLAPSIYYARSMAYGDGPHWDALSPELHRSYIDIAQKVLMDLAPKPQRSADDPRRI